MCLFGISNHFYFLQYTDIMKKINAAMYVITDASCSILSDILYFSSLALAITRYQLQYIFILLSSECICPQVGVRTTPAGQMQVAPITGSDLGLKRAEIKGGVREVISCKDADGKIGLRVRHVNKVNNTYSQLLTGKCPENQDFCNLTDTVSCMLVLYTLLQTHRICRLLSTRRSFWIFLYAFGSRIVETVGSKNHLQIQKCNRISEIHIFQVLTIPCFTE